MITLKRSGLYTTTNDPGAASTDAVVRPRRGAPPLQWYRDTKPRFYRPYLIRVLELDDTMMKFVFLDRQTGVDLGPPHEISYHDGRYAYSALPSTAQFARPGNEQSPSCGLLFISDLYMEEKLPQSFRATLIGTGGSDAAAAAAGLRTRITADSKWPYSAGTSFEDVAQMVELRKSVT